MRNVLVVGAVLVAATALIHPAKARSQSPYAGETEREIKALSEDEIASYLAGEGMGFAMAAELNRYPGPKHVLELATELEVSDEQREVVQVIFDGMQAEARRLGEALVETERELDAAFAERSIDPDVLRAHVASVGEIHAELRYAHLVAHLQTTDALTAAQIEAYDMYRGYGDHAGHGGHHQ
ncbi:MAG: hypothetical protein GKS06_14015 [Acidobacteria bacterium]|nr:hypothetical protein [Acidobacteriota bacterium]